jgi:transcriptional regulator with XRE-family HTH domain
MAKSKSDYGQGKRKPSPVDIHVGTRVWRRRVTLDMTQSKLGDAMGLSYQQVENYEKGVNRVGASRLFKLSLVLGVPIEYFFEDMGPEVAASPLPTKGRGKAKKPASYDPAPMTNRETLELVRAYYTIEDVNVRKRVYEMTKILGATGA